MTQRYATPHYLSKAMFSFDPQTSTFTAEMSEVRGFARVASDRADQGFIMVDPRSFAELVFVLEDERHDLDGSITSWELRTLDGRFFAKVWND